MKKSAQIIQGIDEIIGDKRHDIFQLAEKRGAYNIRLFGSVARGEARPDSDIDFLVEFQKGTTIWDVVGFWRELGILLERDVSVLTDGALDEDFQSRIANDIVPL